mmetsp:Transcript_6994/g.16305  ORF Transcript_6994/g.16305 Transcript_6994/m.16305 type:complete len:233 (-) Transcript_6994:3094-3792(-)
MRPHEGFGSSSPVQREKGSEYTNLGPSFPLLSSQHLCPEPLQQPIIPMAYNTFNSLSPVASLHRSLQHFAAPSNMYNCGSVMIHTFGGGSGGATAPRPDCIECRHDMNDSAMRFSTRMKTDRVAALVETSRHWLYFSCRMSRLDRLICARMRKKRSSGGSSHVSVIAASLAWLSSCVQSAIASSILDDRLRPAASALPPPFPGVPHAPPEEAFDSSLPALSRFLAALCMPCR